MRSPRQAVEFDPSTSRARALSLLRRVLTDAGLDSPALEARLLLTEALRIDAAELALRPEAPIRADAAARLTAWAERRLAREPVSRILGTQEFWGLPFRLSPGTLAPRPDTETVIEAALSLVARRDAPLRILDLGTGSGCLLIALLHELPNAWGLGIDRSLDALTTARRNATANAVGTRSAFLASDWAAAVRGRFDLIVSNPPYIPSADLPGLDPEVREHDPLAALDGGVDGLDAYRTILGAAHGLLAPEGALVLEIGLGQAKDLKRLAVDRALEVARIAPDLAGIARAVVLRRAK